MNEEEGFRFWIEIRELENGSVRTLPLNAVMKIVLAKAKKNSAPIPKEELLHLKDGAETFEAKSFDELRVQLRDKYPDGVFERTFHFERDRGAEERREWALNRLAELLAKQVMDEIAK